MLLKVMPDIFKVSHSCLDFVKSVNWSWFKCCFCKQPNILAQPIEW